MVFKRKTFVFQSMMMMMMMMAKNTMKKTKSTMTKIGEDIDEGNKRFRLDL